MIRGPPPLTPLRWKENKRAKILKDYQIQTDKQFMLNQPDILVDGKSEQNSVIKT